MKLVKTVINVASWITLALFGYNFVRAYMADYKRRNYKY